MKFNTEERRINAEGHDLISQGKTMIYEAERLRNKRKAGYEQAIVDEKRRQEERIAMLRKECMDSCDDLVKDIARSVFAYRGIVMESVTSNCIIGGAIGDAGEIIIKFHRKD